MKQKIKDLTLSDINNICKKHIRYQCEKCPLLFMDVNGHKICCQKVNDDNPDGKKYFNKYINIK